MCCVFFFFSSRRRHTRCLSDWSSDVCSSDLGHGVELGSGISADTLGDAVAAGVAGRYGGGALLAAALKKLTDHSPRLLELPATDPRLGCRVAVTTDIPRQVGPGGASARVVAALRAR